MTYKGVTQRCSLKRPCSDNKKQEILQYSEQRFIQNLNRMQCFSARAIFNLVAATCAWCGNYYIFSLAAYCWQ